MAAAALTAVVIIAALVWNSHRAANDRNPMSVSVLPFEALSNSEDVRTLARRVPNEVVDALGDSQIEAALGGESAGKIAGLIVTGIVRDDATNSVVDVRIEDGATRTALWSTEFRRRSSEVSDLPLEVAARVTDVVDTINFARSADPPLTDDTALSALLQTTDMIRDARGGAWAQLIEHAQSVVARYPKFAFGHDVLAYAYWKAAEDIDVPDRAHAMSNAARREANLTLKLDPLDAGAYAILAGQEAPYDYGAQEEILLRGIKTSRHPKGALGGLYSGESGLLQNVGRLREGLTIGLSAHAVDQWGAPKSAKLAIAYANMGDLATARELIEKGVRLWPNHSGIIAKRRFIAGFYEKPSEALKIFDSLDAPHSPDESNAIWRTYVEARAAHSARVRGAALDRIREAADKGVIPRETEIMMLAGLGETKAAIDAANSALDHQQRLEAWFLFTPITQGLRTDPGFVPLAARMGLIKYWRDTGKRPDFCTDPARQSECTPQLLAALKS
jgi:TolB-like protein/tetratricopeptide (TPR) repeat protein